MRHGSCVCALCTEAMMFLIDHIFRSRHYGCNSLFVSAVRVNHIPWREPRAHPVLRLAFAQSKGRALLFLQVTRHLISLDAPGLFLRSVPLLLPPMITEEENYLLGRLGQISFSRPCFPWTCGATYFPPLSRSTSLYYPH